MTDLSHHIPLTFTEAMDAVRRAVLDPDPVPSKVLAGAVRAVSPRGPSRWMLDEWRIESARGPAVSDLAALIGGAGRGRVDAEAVDAVRARYGSEGVVVAVSAAAMLATEFFTPRVMAPATGLGLGRGRRLGAGLAGLAQRLHRSLGVVPARWKALARLDGIVLRWWDAHEGVMAPGRLTGEEKWLAMAVLTGVMEDRELAGLYAGFLRRQGWSPADVEMGMRGELARLRPGLVGGMEGVAEMVAGGLDRRRVELAGARLPAEAMAELVDVAGMARAMVVLAILD